MAHIAIEKPGAAEAADVAAPAVAAVAAAVAIVEIAEIVDTLGSWARLDPWRPKMIEND